ncbi:unnamed protein product [Prorocentrum cordatum]|uniref:Uncharacterized protein n=1 Tax=Prorocentrum cordatum TaxID=2364126 RepID=A0ABN9UUM6_9DINO|nr:unnamed protein product [Polarella glacialis]
MMKALRAPVPASAALQDHHSVSFSRAGVPAVVTPVGFDDSYAASTPAAWLHAGELPQEPRRVRLVGLGLPLPREEEVPWPARLAQAAGSGSGCGDSGSERSFQPKSRAQRRRVQRKVHRERERQAAAAAGPPAQASPAACGPPGVFAQPARAAQDV